MPDYKELYFKLFGACADVMEILQRATLEAELLAIESKSLQVIVATEDEADG